jgi:hypothetical protein
MTPILFLLNETMAVLTITVVFPGVLLPKDRMEWVMAAMMMIPMSLVWPVFLVLSPVTFGLLWWAGELKDLSYWATAWPWDQF